MTNKIILIVEDNELNMKLMRMLLQGRKYEIMEAIDAETGIELARQCTPDLILMDIQLPGMDGLAATRVIKADPVLCNIPVLAVTSFAMDSDMVKAREAGCAGHISKPFCTRAFLPTINYFINNSDAAEVDS